MQLVRGNGFAATSVDQLCAHAGVTKGAFFHHFASKEALGVAAADYWSECTGAFFAEAPFHHHADPVDRVLGYIDLRLALIGGPVESFSCVAGTMVQEAFRSSAAIRIACEASIIGNARALEADIAEAMVQRGVTGTTAESLSRHVQVVIQGAFVVAKTQEESAAPDMARDALRHLRRYFEFLFRVPQERSADQ
ncbi:transcriptional regulator of tetR family [Novosphingobium sp. MD-1]|nr:transcriptional regulator of tetR family [Novosphingobium sp. MD-1]